MSHGSTIAAQLGDSEFTSRHEPAQVPLLDGKHIIGIACGPAQSIAWSSSGAPVAPARLPFVIDVCDSSLRQLDQLLADVADGLDLPSEWPPTQERECMTVSALNLLNLQVRLNNLLA